MGDMVHGRYGSWMIWQIDDMLHDRYDTWEIRYMGDMVLDLEIWYKGDIVQWKICDMGDLEHGKYGT